VEWLRAEPIETARLTLEPLRADHATEMVEVLADPRLYEYIGGAPPTPEQLRTRYALQVVGHSPDRRHGWLNWIARDRDAGGAVGTVQATLTATDGRRDAEIAWVIGTMHQGRGYAKEAAAATMGWLRSHGTDTITAHINPDHEASMAVARYLGLAATEVIEDGEVRWESPGPLAGSDS
jgi:RimJ/RimL family protein N-acetyltransferase